jgi:hypothetical protein
MSRGDLNGGVLQVPVTLEESSAGEVLILFDIRGFSDVADELHLLHLNLQEGSQCPKSSGRV